MKRSLVIAALLAASAFGVAAQTPGTVTPRPLPPLANPNDPNLPAKELFGRATTGAPMEARAFGFYSRGCVAGAVALPVNGETWQVMRLSRNRMWGHPDMMAFLERFARKVPQVSRWPGILVGDISQPRGGPMLTGHASHQIGLDADIWLTPMPDRRLSANERETIEARSMLKSGALTVDNKRWTPAHAAILKQAASYPEVERILVHPGIKKKLCETVRGDRSWLRKVRPFWGHDAHFHVRIGCQPGSSGCKEQSPPPPGEGCDKSLAWWFTEEPWRPNKNPDAPKARDVMTMASLPKECRAVLAMPAPESEMAVTIGGNGTAVAVAPAAPEPAEDAAPELSAPSDPTAAFAPTPKVGIPMPKTRPGG